MEMVKRFLYMLTLAALVCSCVKDNLQEPCAQDEIGVEHNGKVTLGFNVEIPGGMAEGTKALAETPDIRNIYVAVFDATGYKLSEYVKADPITTGPQNDKKYQFTIQLKVSDKKRVLHFIANGPEEIRFGTEQEVIGELFTRYNAEEGDDEYSRKDAYWQRLVFDKISPRPEGADNGSQAWQDYNSMVETLSNLKLIRNFSKVTLSKKTPLAEDSANFKNFKILGMWFVNYPDRGSIAPYNRNTGTFGTERGQYLDWTNMTDMEDPAKGNYQGFTLASTEFVTPDDFTDSNMIAASGNTATGYVYEREKALNSPMYLILKCEYAGNEAYYKVAMQDEDGNFYAMLRNFNYNVQIQNVTSAGYGTALEALNGVPTGDISINVDYQDLPNISDGNARITVNATKLMIVGKTGESTTASFWYKYEPDITNHEDTGICNDPASGNETTDHAKPHVLITYEGTEGSTGPVIEDIDIEDEDDGGNRYVTISTTEASATPKTQVISIEGRRWDGSRYQTITRTIQLVLRDAIKMSLSASPNTDSDNAANVLAQSGQSVVLHLGIEQDLPSSMFPLYFKLDPSVNSLTPDNAYSDIQELPARYGTGEDERPAYWFEKTINWTDYESAPVVDGNKDFPIYFKTMIAANATTIEVSNEYFDKGTVQVKNYTPGTFTSVALSGGTTHKVGTQETLSFTIDGDMPSDGVIVKMKGVEPVTGSGSGYSDITLQTTSDGYWYYKLTPTATSVSLGVMPYSQGTMSIELSAFKYDSNLVSAYVLPKEGTIDIYTTDNFLTITDPKVNGDHLVAGQKATLTFYLPESSGTVKLTDGNGTQWTASRNGSAINLGIDMYPWTVTGFYATKGDNSNGFNEVLPVSVNGATAKCSVTVPVYGIRQESEATSSPFSTSSYFLIKSSAGRYLYNPGSNNATAILSNGTIQFSSLMKINGGEISTVSTSTTYYLDFNYSRSGTYNYSYSYNPRLDNANSTDFAYTYQAGSGFTLSQTFDEKARYNSSANNVTRYMYDNGGTIAQNTTPAYWHIYPVTFVAPE